MKLQLALDDLTWDEAQALLEKAGEYTDIIEIGTPFVIEYGMEAVRAVRRQFPQKEILCDTKIMDGGAVEANSAFRAGADYVTVMAVTDAQTVREVVKAARDWKKIVVADLLCVEDFKKTVPYLESIGVDMLAVHVGVDQQQSGRTPLQDLITIKALLQNARVAVAGGLDAAHLAEYTAHRPDVLVVGGAITHAANPAEQAKNIFEQIVRGRQNG